MLTQEEMIGLQAEKHGLVGTRRFESKEEYVLYLIHTFAYTQAAKIAGSKRVLDLGCNVGYGSQILSKAAKQVVGVDVSETAISIAKESYVQEGIDFFLIDGIRLPFDDGAFDLIVSCQVIEHVVDYDGFIGELKRVLAPDGVCVLTTPNGSLRLDPLMKPWNEFHVREFSPSELRETMENYFSAVEVFGLSGKESICQVERDRILRARSFARKKKTVAVSRAFESTLRSLVPEKGLSMLKTLWTSVFKRHDRFDSADAKKYRMEDLFYVADPPDTALDLLAVCSNDEAVRSQFDVLTVRPSDSIDTGAAH